MSLQFPDKEVSSRMGMGQTDTSGHLTDTGDTDASTPSPDPDLPEVNEEEIRLRRYLKGDLARDVDEALVELVQHRTLSPGIIVRNSRIEMDATIDRVLHAPIEINTGDDEMIDAEEILNQLRTSKQQAEISNRETEEKEAELDALIASNEEKRQLLRAIRLLLSSETSTFCP